MSNDEQHEGTPVAPELLAQVDDERRSALRRILITTAYAVPVVASFSLAGLSTSEAANYVSNLPA